MSLSRSHILSTMTSATATHHHPFHNIITDCKHLIFLYYIRRVDSDATSSVGSSQHHDDNDNFQNDTGGVSAVVDGAGDASHTVSPYSILHWSRKDCLFLHKYVKCFYFDAECHQVMQVLRMVRLGLDATEEEADALLESNLHWETSDDADSAAAQEETDTENNDTASHQKRTNHLLHLLNQLPLQYLDVSGNVFLTNHLYLYVRGIKYLDISHTSGGPRDRYSNSDILEYTPQLFQHLRGIETLRMSGIGVLEEALFSNLRGVKHLNISYCRNFSSKCFQDLRGIEELYMSNITNEDPNIEFLPDHFINLRGIKALDISRTDFELNDFCLENLRGIDFLDISDCVAVDFTNGGFSNLRGIKCLNMARVTEGINGSWLKHIRGVESLDLTQCTQFEDADFMQIRGIKRLHIGDCNQITNAALKQIRGVEEINLQSCSSITAEGFENLRGVKMIGIGGESLSDETMHLCDHVFEQLRGLDSINIADCTRTIWKDSWFENLMGLRDLVLEFCELDGLTNKAFQYIGGQVRNIRLTGCSKSQLNKGLLQYLNGIKVLYLTSDLEGRITVNDMPGLRKLFSNLRVLVVRYSFFASSEAEKEMMDFMLNKGAIFSAVPEYF